MKDFKILVRFSNPTENLSRYFSDIMKEEILNPQTEAELALKARHGDKLAKEKIIRSNLRFVVSVAKAYSGKNAQLEDLISEGNKGLVEAIELFDPTTGFKFISYAVWHIRKNIFLYLNNNSRIIRLPGNLLNELKRYQSIENAFTNEHDREPSLEEVLYLIDEKGLDPISTRTVEIIKNKPTSIPLESSSNPDDESGKAPINWISAEEIHDHFMKEEDNKVEISRILSALKENERKMVEMKYGLNGFSAMSFFQIGNHFGKTPEWARLNLSKIEKRLKIIARKKGIKNWI
jgi:RNA polymerase primary sigma factor